MRYARRTRLEDALTKLGISLAEIPLEVQRAPWFVQRIYFEETLQLAYCARCKLPIADSEMAVDATSMCLGCRKGQLDAWSNYHQRNPFTNIMHRTGSSTKARDNYARLKYNRNVRKRMLDPNPQYDFNRPAPNKPNQVGDHLPASKPETDTQDFIVNRDGSISPESPSTVANILTTASTRPRKP